MTTAVIGATGRVGSEIVRGVLARGGAVAALVRDPARRAASSANPAGCASVPRAWTTRATWPRRWTGIGTVFIAMGSAGTEGVLPRIAISAAAGVSSVGQVTRLPVLNTSAGSLGINQRARHSIDLFAAAAAVAVLDDPPRDLLGVAARRGA